MAAPRPPPVVPLSPPYLRGPVDRGEPVHHQRAPGEVAEEAHGVVLAQAQRRWVPDGGHARAGVKPAFVG